VEPPRHSLLSLSLGSSDPQLVMEDGNLFLQLHAPFLVAYQKVNECFTYQSEKFG
jgi:hypothetical protein